jgi:hypothetical protein
MDIRIGVPQAGKSVQLAVDVTTNSVALPENCDFIRVVSDNNCCISFGLSTVTASLTIDMPIYGHVPEYFRKDPLHTTIAGISAASACTVTVTPVV